MVFKEAEVGLPVARAEEHGLAMIATLGDVMRNIDEYDARMARHPETLAKRDSDGGP
jgi:hypothetical protein